MFILDLTRILTGNGTPLRSESMGVEGPVQASTRGRSPETIRPQREGRQDSRGDEGVRTKRRIKTRCSSVSLFLEDRGQGFVEGHLLPFAFARKPQ